MADPCKACGKCPHCGQSMPSQYGQYVVPTVYTPYGVPTGPWWGSTWVGATGELCVDSAPQSGDSSKTV